MNHKRLLTSLLAWLLFLSLPALTLPPALPLALADQTPAPHLQDPDSAAPDNGSGRMVLTANLEAADTLAAIIRSQLLPKYTLLVAPLADLDRPGQSSPLGRLVSQQVASRLVQHGFAVIESDKQIAASFRDQHEVLTMAQEGMGLTYALPSGGSRSRAALMGTYKSGREIYVSLRLVRLQDSVVIAAYEYVLPRCSTTCQLLADRQPLDIWRAHTGRKQALSDLSPVSPPPMMPTGLDMDFPDLADTAH